MSEAKLTVVSVLETPLDVLDWGLLKVMLCIDHCIRQYPQGAPASDRSPI